MIWIPIALIFVTATLAFFIGRYELKHEKKIINKRTYRLRLVFSLVYFALGIMLIYLFRDKMFYLKGRSGFGHWPRLVWVFSTCCFGFAFIVTRSRFQEETPKLPYIFYYPCILALLSFLIFSVLSLFEQTSGYIFYSLSIFLGVTFGYLSDYYWEFIKELAKKAPLGK